MRYRLIAVGVTIMGIIAFLSEKLGASKPPRKVKETFYDFKATSLDGELIDFTKYRGKMVMVVNTASKCGYTPQFKQLQKLHETYGDKVEILGFPANNFLWQEPGTNEEIATFCEKNYGVSFQMFEKISVKGKNQHPVYQWLEARSGKKPSWNFCKYIIDRNGEVIGFFPPSIDPMSTEILNLLQVQ